MELEMLEHEILYHFNHIMFVSFIGNRARLSLKPYFGLNLKVEHAIQDMRGECLV
jgi:hypothetical protein